MFYFVPILGEMVQFDEHVVEMGWFNHELEYVDVIPGSVPKISPAKSALWGAKKIRVC